MSLNFRLHFIVVVVDAVAAAVVYAWMHLCSFIIETFSICQKLRWISKFRSPYAENVNGWQLNLSIP